MRYRVPASTSNLGHGFDCLGMAVDLANIITLEPCEEPPTQTYNGLSRLCATVRTECENIFGTSLPPLEISIVGEVPIARGLGSSATITIALAAAYQRLAGDDLDRDALMRIGYTIEGHPDNVAAAALGGFTIAADLESGLRCMRFAAPAGLSTVLTIPDYEVKTADARRSLPQSLNVDEAVRGWQRASLISAALASGDIEQLTECFQGAWHEQYRAQLNPQLGAVRAAAAQAGAVGTFLSGSGSTILSLCRDEQAELIAQTIRAHLEAEGFGAVVRIALANNSGVEVLA